MGKLSLNKCPRNIKYGKQNAIEIAIGMRRRRGLK